MGILQNLCLLFVAVGHQAGVFECPSCPHCACSDQVDCAGIVLSLESRCSEALAAACEQLKQQLPAGSVISESRDSSAINTPVASPAAALLGPAEPN
jgi:hypothetical protein